MTRSARGQFRLAPGRALLAVCAMLFVSETRAGGDAGGAVCPAIWADYVAMVSTIIKPLGPDFPLLFEKRGGGVFDCLNLVQNEEVLNRANEISRNDGYNVLPEFTEVPLDPSEPQAWPANICGRAEIRTPSDHFFFITLPLDEEILETVACQERIRKTVFRLLAENDKSR